MTDLPATEKPTRQPGPPSNLFTGVIKALRPRQWVKNLLVLAAPLAALGGDQEYDLGFLTVRVAIAFVVFCMAASSIYLVNDAQDVEADREHPTKRFRPIAAGVVPVGLAYSLAVLLGVAALVISWLVTPNLAVVIAVYLVSSWPTALASNIRRCWISASSRRRI